MRLYRYDYRARQLQEMTTSHLLFDSHISSLNWSANGQYLAVGKIRSNGVHQVELYQLGDLENLYLVNGYTLDADVLHLSWGHESPHLAIGSEHGTCTLALDNGLFTLRDVKLCLNSTVQLNISGQIEGRCVINGGGHILDLSTCGSLHIQPGATLVLEDMIVKGCKQETIHCVDETSELLLRDVIWVQECPITFSQGTMRIENEVKMRGDATITYQSSRPITIMPHATFNIDRGITISYESFNREQPQLFTFMDEASRLILRNAALHVSSMGLVFTQGNVVIEGDVSFASDPGKGITFGVGDESCDCTVEIRSGATLTISKGSLHYKNKSKESLITGNASSCLYICSGVKLCLFQPLNIGSGLVLFEKNATLIRAANTGIVGGVSSQGDITYHTL